MLSVDLRSDTVTRPTAAMREAMMAAEVGDDVYGDDPTVNALQARAAALFGKEAALLVPTGTMGNLISVLTHCRERGSEYIVGDEAHIYYYEQGGAAQLGGAHPRVLPTALDGTLALDAIEHAIRSDDPHYPVTKVICLENTHNRRGGRVLPTAYVDAVGALAQKHGLKLHIDGARIMNAAIKLNEDPARMVRAADSVSICLSKALGAPVGSVIVGSKSFIYHARRLRKALGGGMRQAGVLAAPGLIALEQMPSVLAKDHANAKRLAEGIAGLAPLGVAVDVDTVETNIVFVNITRKDLTAETLIAQLRELGTGCGGYGDRVRFVMHHQVSAEQVDTVVAQMRAVLEKLPTN